MTEQNITKKENKLVKKLEPLMWFIGRTVVYITVGTLIYTLFGGYIGDKALGSITLRELSGSIFSVIIIVIMFNSYFKGFDKYEDSKDTWSPIGWVIIVGLLILGIYLWSDASQQNNTTESLRNNQTITTPQSKSNILNTNVQLSPSPTTQNINSSSDSFPFNNPDQQYSWYDRNNIPMSNRCYTTMTPPCSNLQWEQALGASLTPQENQAVKLQWCQKFASSWNETIEQCVTGQ